MHRRGLAGGASAEARSQYESIEEVQAEPDQEGEEEVFDEFAVAPSRKTKKTASIVGGSDARSMVSGTRSRAGGRYLGRGSDDEDSISNDSLLNFIPPKSTRTGGSRGKSKLVEAIKIADSEESDEDDPTKFRLRR